MAIFAKERNLTPSWDLFGPSWELLKQNIWTVVYLSLIPSLVLTLGLLVAGPNVTIHKLHGNVLLGVIIFGIGLLMTALANPGLIYMQAKAVQGVQVGPWESFQKGLGRFLPLLVMNVLFGFMMILGFLVLIIPGLIVFRRYFIAEYYLVDQKLGPLQALAASARDTKPVSAWVWGTVGVVMVFVLIGGLLGNIPKIGDILSTLVALPYIFGPALRYGEITRLRTVLAKDSAE